MQLKFLQQESPLSFISPDPSITLMLSHLIMAKESYGGGDKKWKSLNTKVGHAKIAKNPFSINCDSLSSYF